MPLLPPDASARVTPPLCCGFSSLLALTVGVWIGNDLPDEEREYPATAGMSPCLTAEDGRRARLAGLAVTAGLAVEDFGGASGCSDLPIEEGCTS